MLVFLSKTFLNIWKENQWLLAHTKHWTISNKCQWRMICYQSILLMASTYWLGVGENENLKFFINHVNCELWIGDQRWTRHLPSRHWTDGGWCFISHWREMFMTKSFFMCCQIQIVISAFSLTFMFIVSSIIYL